MWLASQASVIVANKNNPTEFGSIGVLMVAEDYTNMMEAGNLPKMQIIRAPQSTEKALVNPIEPMGEDLLASVHGELKDIADSFINVIKEARGEKLDTKAEGLFKGRMFDARTAKQIGLIDSVGTLSTAINKVAELARVSSINKTAKEIAHV
jgi:protease IV